MLRERALGKSLWEAVADVATLNVLPARDQRLGHAQAIALKPDGKMSAGADPRSDGSAAVIH